VFHRHLSGPSALGTGPGLPIIISERELTLSLLASSPLYARLEVAALDFSSGEFDEKMAELRRFLATESPTQS
jgi:hypothetical protein